MMITVIPVPIPYRVDLAAVCASLAYIPVRHYPQPSPHTNPKPKSYPNLKLFNE